MKTANRVRRKSTAAKVPAQAERNAGKSSRADRVHVEVEMSQSLSDALHRECKRSGLTLDAIFELAIRKELSASSQSGKERLSSNQISKAILDRVRDSIIPVQEIALHGTASLVLGSIIPVEDFNAALESLKGDGSLTELKTRYGVILQMTQKGGAR